MKIKNKILIFVFFAIFSILILSNLSNSLIVINPRAKITVVKTTTTRTTTTSKTISTTIIPVVYQSVYQPLQQPQNSKKCFILLSSNDIKSLLQVKDFIKNNGGRVTIVFPPNSMIANLSTSLQNSLNINYKAKIYCYFPVPIPEETNYGKNAVNAAKAWNSGLKVEIVPWTKGLSWGDPRLGKELTISGSTKIKTM